MTETRLNRALLAPPPRPAVSIAPLAPLSISRRAAVGGMAGALLGGSVLGASRARAQNVGFGGDGPLRVTVSGGQFQPVPIALPPVFAATAGQEDIARQIGQIIRANLDRSGLFQIIDAGGPPARIDLRPDFAAERSYGAEAYAAAQINIEPDGRLGMQLRLWNLLTQEPLEQLRFLADPTGYRRVAHKVSDVIYSALTGEDPYFDSRVVFVEERGPKSARKRNLAIMDQDGAGVSALTTDEHLVLTPRFSPREQLLTYISYRSGQPEVMLMDLTSQREEGLGNVPGVTFAPRFSPDGQTVVVSLSRGGITDIIAMDLATRNIRQLTNGTGISTSPSYAPSGDRIVFESDRSGGQQLYVMDAAGGNPTRISFGDGSYATPVWSPKGDYIAFTKILQGRFHIGVMRDDGSEERLLTQSFIDEGPTWAPNGRVIMFFRETPGEEGRSQLFTVDVFGRALRPLTTANGASDPAWSPLLR